MNRPTQAILATAGAFALLTGCSSFADSGPPAAATTSTEEHGTLEEHDHEHGPDDEILDAEPLPTTLPDGARDAVDFTYAAMTAYVDHSGDDAAWFARLTPFLSDQGEELMFGVDPANVPATVLVGIPGVVEASDFLQRLDQPTDAGTYRVLLSRAADGAWQVESITPPFDGPTT